jgi:septum formation protein
VEFSVVVPEGVEELTSGPPNEVVAENAYRKATAVAAGAAGSLVLGVDTIVVLGTRIYGKPADAAEARTTLEALAGRRHTVLSGVCLIGADGIGAGGIGSRVRSAVASTAVEFRALDQALLDWYLETGEWRERAGGYAIQGRGVALVAGIEGDYSNVVGLPVPTLLQLAPGLVA